MPNYFSEKKRKKELPVRAVCRNCGTGLHGRYCHCCGQDLFKGTKRTVGSLVFHAVENVFSIDNRLLISMKCLLFRPGKLTKEYINGRIVRYVHPSKLFWFISIVFFLLLTTRITTENSSSGTKETAETVAGIPPETSGAADILAGSINRRSPALRQHAGLSGDAADRKSATKTDKLEDKVIQTNSDGMFIRNLLRYAPYVSFLLIPFFAFLLNLFFRRRELFYADHLVFALHFHAFVFFLFTLYLIITEIFPTYNIGIYFFLYIPLIYFVWAIWVVYRPKIKTLLFKIGAIFIFYGITVIASMIALIFILAGLGEMIDIMKEAVT